MVGSVRIRVRDPSRLLTNRSFSCPLGDSCQRQAKLTQITLEDANRHRRDGLVVGATLMETWPHVVEPGV